MLNSPKLEKTLRIHKTSVVEPKTKDAVKFSIPADSQNA